MFVEPLESRRLLAAYTFAIDRDLSSLSIDLEADVGVGELDFDSQYDGGEEAELTGTIRLDISAKGVRFLGGSAIDFVADDEEAQPFGTPADYALEADVEVLGSSLFEAEAALRDLAVDLTSTRVPVRQDARNRVSFSANRVTAEFDGGSIAYDGDFDVDGEEDFAGDDAQVGPVRGRIAGIVGKTITIPVDLEFEKDFGEADGTLKLRGKIVASAAGPDASGSSLGPIVKSSATATRRASVADEVIRQTMNDE